MSATLDRDDGYLNAIKAQAAGGIRSLLCLEQDDDPRLQALVIRVDADGTVEVELLGSAKLALGGYTL